MENCFCFVCLKTSVNSTTFTFGEEAEDGNDKGLSVFWKFVKNYLRIKSVAPAPDCDEKKVKQRLCDDCAPLINSISQLYLELLGIQLRLSWKLGELANLFDRSVRESSITSESHHDAVLSMADQFGTGSGFDFENVSQLAQIREELSANCAKQAQEYLPDPPFVESKIKMLMEIAEPKDCSFWASINDGGGGEDASNEPNECYPCASDEEEEEKISVPVAKRFCLVSKTEHDFQHEMSSTSTTDSEKGSKEKDPVFTQKMIGEMKLKPTNLEPIPSKKQEEIPHLKKESCWWTCKLCGLTSAGKIHEHLQSHEKALPRHRKPLHCLFCYRTFAYSQSLQHHVTSWHTRFSKMLTKEGFLLCQEEGCIDVDGDGNHEVEFDSVSSLNQHLKTHLKNREESLHLCSSCGLGFLDKNLLNLHKLLHIRPKTTSQGRRVACPVCGKKCNDSSCLQGHYNIYHGVFLKTHKCSECSKVCASAKGVRNHWKRFHSGAERPQKLLEDPVFCLECGKQLKNKVRLEEHIGRVHKPVNCDVCGESFIGLDARKEHRIKVHKFRDCCGIVEGKEFSCEICNKKVSSRLQLQKHMSDRHSGKIFECVTCRKVFRRKGELKKHEKKVHEDGDKNNDENTKSHLCSQCGKTYSNPVGLAAHLAIVHKEKNEVEEGGRAGGGAKRKVHDCPHCEEKFGWKYVLDRHLLKAHPGLQIGEGMLECNVCGLRMASGQKSRMDYHKSTHLTMEERRREGMLHMCHHCGKEFRTRWSYKGHIKMHEERKESEVEEVDKRPN